jgi:hypothetical protein
VQECPPSGIKKHIVTLNCLRQIGPLTFSGSERDNC